MNFTPPTIKKFMSADWSDLEPYYQELLTRPFDAASVAAWLADWSELRKLVDETYARLQLTSFQNTADAEAEERYYYFLENLYPKLQAADQQLKEKLLASDLEPEGMRVPLMRMRAEAQIFRDANLLLQTEERKLGSQYSKITGGQNIIYQGENLTLQQAAAKMHTPERAVREQLWQLTAERQLQNRGAINDLWVQAMELRQQIAANADLPDYRAYRWQQLHRFDYTPQDSKDFFEAIAEVAVPAAQRVYARHCTRLGLDSLRPWDLEREQSTMRFPGIQAYETPEDFDTIAEDVFQQVDPELGAYFASMRREHLLDLQNRPGKSPGAFCTSFATQARPFIFMNAVGMETDVRVLLHEAGHAFHVFERSRLPYHHQWRANMEFNEVASTAMEFLAAPYLSKSHGGYFSKADAARARVQHLENTLLFWPYMAVVSAFQHWVYEHPTLSSDPAQCDAQWSALNARFMPSLDWSGLEDALATGWHRKLHIHRYPFYYIEYGLSQLGAVQIWANALNDQACALVDYRAALALGGTATIPELYAAAGVRLAFDVQTLGAAVDLLERTILELEG
ncbi:MAG: M3 family oligoendopeptidase [Anaerolineae bacterium]|nr:M3 family oligoendopeptidase [Anaerolineae bacterium]MBL6965308.1 M3 family oligoendopeptidase [Anaerolineales bacterium]